MYDENYYFHELVIKVKDAGADISWYMDDNYSTVFEWYVKDLISMRPFLLYTPTQVLYWRYNTNIADSSIVGSNILGSNTVEFIMNKPSTNESSTNESITTDSSTSDEDTIFDKTIDLTTPLTIQTTTHINNPPTITPTIKAHTYILRIIYLLTAFLLGYMFAKCCEK